MEAALMPGKQVRAFTNTIRNRVGARGAAR